MIKTVLFDLDGTLLPMDQELFTKAYFRALTEKLSEYYRPDELIDAVWKGTAAMVRNDGSTTNEAAFWKRFTGIFGELTETAADAFNSFYENDFARAKGVCGFAPEAAELVSSLRRDGFDLVIASNPIFPQTAQRQRIEWAGVDPSLFDHITSFENSSYCKPNPMYYSEIIDKLGLKPEECLMVGNDVNEDMVAADVGMSVFLMTHCLINSDGRDISQYPHGSFKQAAEFIEANARRTA